MCSTNSVTDSTNLTQVYTDKDLNDQDVTATDFVVIYILLKIMIMISPLHMINIII